MFGRRRDDASTPRPPISSAWWDAPRDNAADAAAADALVNPPPLPGHDPFGAWGAFPPPGDGVTDGVIGQQQLPPGWSVPGVPSTAAPPPHGGPPRRTGPAPHGSLPPRAGSAVPTAAPPPPPLPPGAAPPPPLGAYQPPLPPSNGYYPLQSPVAAQPLAPAAEPSAEDSAPEWVPLLTHEHQRFQIELEEFEPDGEAEYPADRAADPNAPRHDMLPWAPAEAPKRGGRAGRLRGVRARRSAAPGPSPDAEATVATPILRPAVAEPVYGAVEQPDSGQPAVEAASVTEDEGPSSFPSTGWGNPVDDPDPMEAAALAAAFSADYLSWDESAPRRRGAVLLQYLPSDVRGDASLLGWSGKGRQRSEFALPGAVRPDGDGRVVVDVRVRVTPYKAVGASAEPAYEPADEMEVAGVPSAAPAPTARGWKSLDSYWVRLAVPVVREHGRLVVDTWDESLDDPEDGDQQAEPKPATPAEPSGDARKADTRSADTHSADTRSADTGMAEEKAMPKPSDVAAARARAGRGTTKPARSGRIAGRGRAAASSGAAREPQREPETGGAR